MPLFHYTSASSIYSILRSKRLRATDIRYLNDTQELYDGLQRIAEGLKNPSHGLFGNDDYRNKSIEYLRSAFSDEVSFGISEDPLFVLSFSRAEDLLSQWRAYGCYAIEFNEDLLKDSIPSLRTCTYDSKSKNNDSRARLTQSLIDISNEMGRTDGAVGDLSLDSVGELIKLAASFKHKGFLEEQEVRMVAHASAFGDRIQYFPRDEILIPYVEVEFSMDSIRAIHVGPMSGQELAYTSMQGFIKKIEKDWQSDSSNIEYELLVTKSDLPFRTKL